jgi:hypothetical protein
LATDSEQPCDFSDWPLIIIAHWAKAVYRAVPVLPENLDTLNTAHGIREAQKSRKLAHEQGQAGI